MGLDFCFYDNDQVFSSIYFFVTVSFQTLSLNLRRKINLLVSENVKNVHVE